METIEMDGIEYLKASAAAKQFGYTSDYVGQLCRGGKVRARLIGRAWFVDPTSIEEYQQGKYQDDSGSGELSRESDTSRNTRSSRRNVKVRISNKAVTSLHTQKLAQVRNSRTLHVNYEPDESELFPTLRMRESLPASVPVNDLPKKSGSKTVRIRRAEAIEVPIKSQAKRPTTFAADELPEVSLSGKIAVMDVSPEEIEAHETADDADPVVSAVKSHPVVAMTRKRQAKRVVRAVPADSPESASREPEMPAALNFTPAAVSALRRPSPLLRFAPAIATVVALLCVALVLGAGATVITESGVADSSIGFQLANLRALFGQ
jgi:hypothetical protein